MIVVVTSSSLCVSAPRVQPLISPMKYAVISM
jgi:hypothetical protein